MLDSVLRKIARANMMNKGTKRPSRNAPKGNVYHVTPNTLISISKKNNELAIGMLVAKVNREASIFFQTNWPIDELYLLIADPSAGTVGFPDTGGGVTTYLLFHEDKDYGSFIDRLESFGFKSGTQH